MTFDVLVWEITTSYSGSWDGPLGTYTLTEGNFLHVVLDDTTHTLSVWYSPNSSPGGGSELSEGPNLFFGFDGTALLKTAAPFYQYCEGTTLRQIGTSTSFPYGHITVNYNNSECQIAPTCDLEISSLYEITPASGPATADGAITISATSSNGVIKYALNNPDFVYGDPVPLSELDPLADWVSFNTSSEPMVWATGAVPVLTVTPPTTLTPAKSDQFGSYVEFVVGQAYSYNFQFTAFSDVDKYLWIRIQVVDNFVVVQGEKIVAGYATAAGTVLTGTFNFVGQAIDITNDTRLVVVVEYLGGTIYDGTVQIDSFGDQSGTVAQGPDVQTSPIFTDLLPGTYTIYAKDAVGCQDSITFEIPVTIEYGVKYRLEFTDMLKESGKASRLDILERAYAGVINEICGGETPVTIRYEGDRDDPNVALVPSNATLQLLVETSGQFNSMFLGDDRKYLVKHYIESELYWTGYIIPEFHSEPYLFEPYTIEITASDGLGELKNKDFKDINENAFKGELKALKIIAEILKKTNLDLNIRSGINVFDSGMDTDPEDDPLDQAYIDSRIYYNQKKVAEKCDTVLRSIVDVFRGQIFQSMGVWWVIRLSDAVGTFAYREFDSEGVYIENDTFDTVKELDFPSAIHAAGKIMFANKTQLLTFVRNYGYFSITHNLAKDGNLIDEGRFESEDIIDLGSGNKVFKNWNVLLGQGGVRYGHETVVNGDSTGAFYFDYNTAVGSQADTQLYSAFIPMNNSSGQIRFKFQYFVSPTYTVPYIRIAWTLKFRRRSDQMYQWLAYGTNGVLFLSLEEVKNEIFVSTFDQWVTSDILYKLPLTSDFDGLEISYFFHNHRNVDFASIADLQAFDPSTLSRPGGTRRMVAGDFGEINVYTAEYSLDAESLPDIVRPDDYDAGDGNHRWLWRLDKILATGPNFSFVDRIKFDNVSVAFYPLVYTPTTQYIDPPENVVYSEETDPFVTSDFTKDVVLGDLIRFDDDELRNEISLYRGFFRLADGTPTLNWSRSGVEESKRILQILLEDYIAQFSTPQRRLSGLKIATNLLHFVNCLRDNIDGTRYRPMTFEFDVKRAMYTPDMSGVLAGEDGEPPYAPGEFSELEHSNDFLIGS